MKYTDEATGVTFESEGELSPEELEQAFAAVGEHVRASTEEPPADAGWAPTLLRTGGAIAGSVLGGLSPFPGGALVGGAGGAALGDRFAQDLEEKRGAREEYNPYRTVTEGLMGLVAPGVGSSVAKQALKGAGYGALAPVVTDLVEGKDMPQLGELAMSTALGALMSGGSTHMVKKFTSDAAKVVTGSDEIATAATERIEQLPKWATQGRVHGKFVKPEDVIDAILPRKRITGEVSKTGTKELTPVSKFAERYMPTRATMDRLQKQTGVPVYNDYYVISELNSKWSKATAQEAQHLKWLFKGTDTAKRTQYMTWLMSDEGGREVMEGLTKRDKANLQELDRFYEGALAEFGLDSKRFFNEVVPSAAAGADKPEGVADAIWDIASGMTGDSLPTTVQLLRESSFNKIVRPRWAEAVAKYDNKDVPDDVRRNMMRFLNGVYGMTDNQQSRLLDGMSTMLRWMDSSMTEGQARKAANELIGTIGTANTSGLMAFRPAPVIRNLFQGVQTAAPLMGGRWYARGVAAAASKEGRALARAAGIEGNIDELAELQSYALTGVRKVINETARIGLKPFGKVEDAQRAAVYLGTRAKTLDAIKRAKGDFDVFSRRAELGSYRTSEAAILEAAFKAKGTPEDIADEAGKMMVNNTQWMYSPVERPPALNSPVGRLYGRFGTWPASYAEYLREFVLPGVSHRKPDNAGRILARTLMYNGALVGLLGSIGTYFGDKNAYMDQAGWVGLAPLTYTGGPMVDTTINAAKAANELASGRVGRSSEAFATSLKGLSPVGAPSLGFGGPVGAMGDIEKAMNEPNWREAVGRYLGFKRGKD